MLKLTSNVYYFSGALSTNSKPQHKADSHLLLNHMDNRQKKKDSLPASNSEGKKCN
jgi:hypothetical protein